MDGPRDPVEPDFVLAPADCPRGGTRELLSSGLLMVAEIVSPGSVVDDRDRKPGIYASGLVPVTLLIDPVAAPATVTVLSDPKEGSTGLPPASRWALRCTSPIRSVSPWRRRSSRRPWARRDEVRTAHTVSRGGASWPYRPGSMIQAQSEYIGTVGSHLA
ncbi:hypothetical protein ACFQX6_32040 [Streptosporangium lutulentum]